MATIKATKAFSEELMSITSLKVERDLRRSVEALQSFPELGSTKMPRSIKRLYGSNVRKISVEPFLLIYHYSKREDVITLYGLVNTRAVR